MYLYISIYLFIYSFVYLYACSFLYTYIHKYDFLRNVLFPNGMATFLQLRQGMSHI